MADDSVIKKVLQGLGSVAEETGRETIKQGGEIGHDVVTTITGKELLGNIADMTDEDYAKKQFEEKQNKEKEIASLRAQMGAGRNVEAEMKQIEDEEENEKRRQEQQLLEEVRLKREMEEREAAQMAAAEGSGKNKGPKKPHRKGKQNQPTDDQMTATGEFKGKVD